MNKFTEWYPASVKPVRKGFYQCDAWKNAEAYTYWNGEYFEKFILDIPLRLREKSEYMAKPGAHWRGLSEKSK